MMIRYELHGILAREEVRTQERLSVEFLNRQDSTVVSKWLSRKVPPPRKVAGELDKLFGDTTLGISWKELLEALRDAEEEHGRDRPGPGDMFDVFLASPMSAAWNAGTFEQDHATHSISKRRSRPSR